MKAPLVSVVIPTYNSASTLSKTIEALCTQDYPQELLEIVVVDDGSTDKTRKCSGYLSVSVSKKRGRLKQGYRVEKFSWRHYLFYRCGLYPATELGCRIGACLSRRPRGGRGRFVWHREQGKHFCGLHLPGDNPEAPHYAHTS